MILMRAAELLLRLYNTSLLSKMTLGERQLSRVTKPLTLLPSRCTAKSVEPYFITLSPSSVFWLLCYGSLLPYGGALVNSSLHSARVAYLVWIVHRYARYWHLCEGTSSSLTTVQIRYAHLTKVFMSQVRHRISGLCFPLLGLAPDGCKLSCWYQSGM